jgi:NifU-like protein involved in Fe-S cluster formation
MIQGGRFKQELEADIRARFGERGFQIWIEAAQRPELVAPDAVGTLTGACGDTISIALRLKGERIIGTDFDTDGCASSLIAAAAAASLARGKSLDEAVDIDEQAVIEAVGVFPDDDRHCAYLATAALREAIHQWMVQYTTPDEQVENSIQAANEGNAQQQTGNEQRSKL